jgi:hypothetical protein
MSELGDRMELIRTGLAAAVPARLVTRDLEDPAQRSHDVMKTGVYTILALNEQDYTNVPGYEAQTGRQGVLIVGDIAVNEDDAPSKIEDAEFTMIDEIKAYVRNLPAALCVLNLVSVAQSGQVDHPYGWIVARLEYVP